MEDIPESHPESADAETLCELTELTRRSCTHCRDAGLYTPPQGSGKREIGLTARNTEGLTLELDGDGNVWVGADEAIQRGHIGRGRYHW